MWHNDINVRKNKMHFLPSFLYYFMSIFQIQKDQYIE